MDGLGHVSFTTPEPNMLIMGLSKAGTPGTTRIQTVAPDRDTETETHVYLAPTAGPACGDVAAHPLAEARGW
ncbi:hypothetical protein GY661_24560, partial [Escherichia coli]|uniref:hypothetical protein n=2 Tax=Pseudomonadota TaxID=1224 RepID=UPI001827BF5E